MTLSLRRQAKSKRLFLSLHNIPDIHGLKAEVYATFQKLLFKITPNREITSEDQGGCAKNSKGRDNFVNNVMKMGTYNIFPK